MQQETGKAETIAVDSYIQRTQMHKEMILQTLKAKGYRITRQRLILLDIILEENCSCCKEIYYKACVKDKNIGYATVYRMINILEDIKAISRRNIYKIECDSEQKENNVCKIEFENDTMIELTEEIWKQVLQKGLEMYGYMRGRKIRNITMGYSN